MQIVIDIDENVFTRLFDNGTEDYEIVNDDLFAIAKAIRKGTPIPKGQKPCEDAISREYLFKVLDDFCGHDRTAAITLDTLADLVYDIPSVKPQEPILDKIRAEIEELIEWHDCPIEYDNGNDAWYCEACNQAIKIIDKYRGES